LDPRAIFQLRRFGSVAIAVAATALAISTLLSVSAQAAEGGTLRVPFPQPDGGLTPYTFELGYPLMTLIYDTLLWRDSEGKPQPWLAKDLEVEDGGRRVFVELRNGARWHDGEPLTASDVVFSFDFMRERFHPRFTPQLEAIDSVRATGANSVVFELRHPSLGFRAGALADVPILPEHLWAGLPETQIAPPGRAIGSGPYRLIGRLADGGYRFRAHGGYFLGQPRPARLEVPIISRQEATVAALERGEVGMIPANLPPALAERLDGLSVEIATGPLYTGTVLLLNTRTSPFDSRPLRQAVSLAIDPARIAAGVGGAVAADRGYLHPESRWAPRRPLHNTDEQAASQQLSRSAIGEIEVLAPEADPLRREAARQVVLALQRAGAQARLRPLSAPRLNAELVSSGDPQFAAAVVASSPLPSHDPDYLSAVFGSGSIPAPLNRSGYASTRFGQLAAKVAAAPDPAQRRAAVTRELQLLAVDAPEIPLLFADGAYAFRPAEHVGWQFIAGSGVLDKRSFLPLRQEGAGRAAPSGLRADGSGGLGGLAIAAICLLALALGVGAYGLLRD